jgi:basic membrane protein A
MTAVRNTSSHQNPFFSYIGDSISAWSNPARAKKIAKQYYSSGIEILFAACGGSNTGVIQAAEESNQFMIGVDSNQNSLSQTHVLGTVEKKMNSILNSVFTEISKGEFFARNQSVGISENAIDIILNPKSIEYFAHQRHQNDIYHEIQNKMLLQKQKVIKNEKIL